MVLIRGCGLRAVEAERIRCTGPILLGACMGIRSKQRAVQTVRRQRSSSSAKGRLARQVGRYWIGSEVVIEGDIFVENHHDVLDNRGRHARARTCAGTRLAVLHST